MIKKLIINLIVSIIALYIVTKLIAGVTYTGGITFFIIAGIVIGGLNSILKPILKIISLPFIFFTAGLFLVLINGFIFFALDKILAVIDLADIDLIVVGKFDYVLAAIVFGVANWMERFVIRI